MDYKKIGEFIQNRRKELGLTQKQLGEKINVTDKAVSKWERGLGCPDTSILGELSEILNVGIGEILNGEYNETLKDNSKFIMDAVDYSKKVTEENIFHKIKKVLYIILVLICAYISFNGIRQFIYLSSGIKLENSIYDNAYVEYEKLTNNIKSLKEKEYLVYSSKTDDVRIDFAESLEYLVLKLNNTKLFTKNSVIKNSELLGLQIVYNDIRTYDHIIITLLKERDKEHFKYYDLYYMSNTDYDTSGWYIDQNGNMEGSKDFDYEGSLRYYSANLYNYDNIKNNSKTIESIYHNMGNELNQLNKLLELLIEVGDNNAKN